MDFLLGYMAGSSPSDTTRAREAERTATRAEQSAQRSERSLEILADEVNRLRVVSAALWEVIRERTDITEDDLKRAIDAIHDQSEAAPSADALAFVCSACDRRTQWRHKKCMYCGQAAPPREDLV